MQMEVGGRNIFYKITGQGDETVVILQGWGTECGLYDSLASVLATRYRVVQFDFPGFGGSDEPDMPWNVDAYADFFCAFLERLGIARATLMGHSYGGRVIIKLSARENLPFEITRIVLIDSAGIVPPKSAAQKRKIRRYKILKKLFYTKWMHFLFPEIVDDWKGRQGSADYRNATPIMRQCLVMAVNEDLRELFPKVRQEVLLIWGDQDSETPISDARLMEEKMPNAGLAVIHGTGHFCFLEQPVVFGNILKSYFQLEAE